MSEVNLNILKEITLAKLKEESFDDFLDNKTSNANLKQYKALESSHAVLKEDVDSQLRFISMLNQLAVLADNIADAKKRDLDKNKQEEYKDKFEKEYNEKSLKKIFEKNNLKDNNALHILDLITSDAFHHYDSKLITDDITCIVIKKA